MCPLSALLSVEIMALRLPKNKNIKWTAIKVDEQIIVHKCEIFGSLSGLMLNRNKNIGDVGKKIKKCKDKIEGIQWDTKPIKALSIYFGHDIDKCDELNWEDKTN